MPKIFSTEKKQALYALLKKNCLRLMKESGYKGLSIRELARLTGISAGTFYNFYPSKEALLLAMMGDCREALQARFAALARGGRGVGREEFVELYFDFFVADTENVLRYLSRDDLTALLLRADGGGTAETIQSGMAGNAAFLRNPKRNINFNAVMNLTQLINLCLENKDLLVEDELNNTIKTLLNNIADEIFEEDAE